MTGDGEMPWPPGGTRAATPCSCCIPMPLAAEGISAANWSRTSMASAVRSVKKLDFQ